MDVDDTITSSVSAPADAAPEPYSAEWWQARTPTELREIIKRGFGIGQAYDGAVLETERRAREAMRRVRRRSEETRTRNRLTALAAMLAVLVAAMILIWFVR